MKHGEGSAWAYNNKAHVWGGVERGGRVHASVIPHRGGHIVRGQVRKYVLPESVVYSDDYGAYSTLHREGYTHHRINHSAKVYVEGEVHTQTIEGFWSTVKNGIRGTYHAVSHKHLQGYLNEFAWRYNNRGNTEPMFKALLASI